MKKILGCVLVAALMASCDSSRVYETNADFKDRAWLVAEKPTFDFEITDVSIPYDISCNVRNAVSYPYSRLFLNYELADSTGRSLDKKLVSTFLFDQKTGKPFGESGLGDIYDQRIPLLKKFTFPRPGKYKVTFEQYMRTDTLMGILAVGVRVEKSEAGTAK